MPKSLKRQLAREIEQALSLSKLTKRRGRKVNYSAVARDLGIHRTTVKRYSEGKFPKSERRFTKTYNKIQQHRKQYGDSLAEEIFFGVRKATTGHIKSIADIFGVSQRTAREYVKRADRGEIVFKTPKASRERLSRITSKEVIYFEGKENLSVDKVKRGKTFTDTYYKLEPGKKVPAQHAEGKKYQVIGIDKDGVVRRSSFFGDTRGAFQGYTTADDYGGAEFEAEELYLRVYENE